MQGATTIVQRVILSGARYALGDVEARFDTIRDFEIRARAFCMVPDPALWGWGSFFRTSQGLAAMAIASGKATLSAAKVDPSEIDALILSGDGPVGGSGRTHGAFVKAILRGLELEDVAFFGQSLNRCANALAGLDLASALVAAGRFRRVLAITTDRVLDEADRMLKYALFSDGAASCVVSTEDRAGEGYQIVSCARAEDADSLDAEDNISADLSRRVNERLLPPLGLAIGDLAGVMHSNIFKPLLVMKERQAGFLTQQLFVDNIARRGHCFAADPIIILVDRAACGEVRSGRHYLLVSSVPGTRIGILVRKLDG